VALDGPVVALTPGAAQALSMALHELATNALKYGALSNPRGRVALSWSADRPNGQLRLRWAEAGGPPVLAPPARRGFGSRVIGTAVGDQLGGTARWSWEPAGLICDLAMPMARALAGEAQRGAAAPEALAS
jgi:two-component sensor histidine kinase